uniref:Complex I subunit B13 n=1 Tax=Globodera pallida TaxID=36090 RepID=A0A183CEU1_GLOPA
TTGLCGLYVNENPHKELRLLYRRILRVMDMIPAGNQYRMATEEIVKHRLSLVEEEPDIQKLEQKIGMGQIEEVFQQAEYELQTIRLYIQFKCWEPLVEQAEEGQWRWPIGPGP